MGNEMDVKSVFATRVKALREKKGMSQTELANAIGVSRGSISFYENGDRAADINILYKLAQFFDKPSDYLLGITDKLDIESYFNELNGRQIEINTLALDLYRQVNDCFYSLQVYYYNEFGLENDGNSDPVVPQMTTIIHKHLADIIDVYCEIASTLFEKHGADLARDYLIMMPSATTNAYYKIFTEIMRLDSHPFYDFGVEDDE